MIKELFQFRKEDMLMWAGVGVFSMILFVAISLIADSATLVFKDLIGLFVIILLPGYVIVKLYLDNFQVSDNMSKNPDINKAIDKLILSMGCGICLVIPFNFLWNYLLTMGVVTDAGNIVGNVDEEMIYTGSAGFRALFTVIIIIGGAIGYKLFQKKREKASQNG